MHSAERKKEGIFGFLTNTYELGPTTTGDGNGQSHTDTAATPH